MAYPVKNKERHDFYYMVENPAINYKDFLQRCRNNKNKLNREFMEKLIMTPVVKYSCKVDNNGRECSICREYKLWSDYNINTSQSYGYNARCKKCIKYKKEIIIDKIIYCKESKYISPFKLWEYNGELLSVKQIANILGIHKRYYPNIRQNLWKGYDIEKSTNKYIGL